MFKFFYLPSGIFQLQAFLNIFIRIMFVENIGIIIQCLYIFPKCDTFFLAFISGVCLFCDCPKGFLINKCIFYLLTIFVYVWWEKRFECFYFYSGWKPFVWHWGNFSSFYFFLTVTFLCCFISCFFSAFSCAHFYSYCENLLKHTEEDKSCANKHVRYRIKILS